jgi:hypothetical protein
MASRLDFSQIRSLYVGTSSGTTVDTNNVVVVGNIGVGTTSPVAKLHIQAGNPRILLQDSSTGYPYIQANNSSGNFYFSIDNAAGTGFGSAYGRYIYSDGAYPVIFVTQDAERMRIAAAGNVGIGTTAPLAILSVGSGSLADGNLPIQISTAGGVTERYIGINKNGGYGLIVGYNESAAALSGVGAYIRQVTADPLHFVVNNSTTAMTILSGGNVGIGNTTPGAVLTVGTQSSGTAGSGVAQDNSIVGRFGAANAAGRVTALTIANTATPTVGNDATLSFIVGGNYSATGLISSILQNTGTARTDMAFSVYNVDNNYERMRITGSGNVGIGTTSPAAKLQLGGSAKITGGDWPTANAGMELNYVGNTSYIGSYDRTSSVYKGLFLFADNMTFETAGSVRMVIASGGNVGIGTTNPYEKLDIVGNIRLGNYTDTSRYIGFANNTFSNQFIAGMQIESTTLGGNYSQKLNFATHRYAVSAGVRMTIDEIGRVGINTSSPAYTLDVHALDAVYNVRFYQPSNANTSYNGNIFTGAMTSAVGYFGVGGSAVGNPSFRDNVVFGSQSSHAVVFNTNDVERMRITSGGNVGIDISAPLAKLHISGVGAYNTGIIADGNAANGVGLALRNANGHDWYLISTGSGNGGGANNLGFYNDSVGQYRVYFKGDGNVGIGNTSPSYPLDVSGTARATTFLVTNATSSTGLYITSNAASAGGAIIRIDKAAADRQSYVTFDSDQLYLGVPASNTTIGEVGTKGSVDLRFATAYSERMRITAAGNVGIGTTSPTTILELGLANLSNPTNNQFLRVNAGKYNEASTSNLDLFNWGNNFGQPLGWRISSATDSVGISVGRFLSFSTVVTDGSGNVSTASERLRITSGGNVGINTTNPAYKLDVIGSVRSYSGFTSNGYHGDTFIQNILPAANNGASSGDVQLRMWCSEPGITWAWAGFGYNVLNDGASPYGFGRWNTGFGQAYMRFSTEGDMYFYNTTISNVRTTTMTLSPVGNVGIGTTSPLSKQQNQISANGSALFLVNAAGGGGAYVDLDFNTYDPYQSGYANPGATIRVIDDGAYSGHITFRTKGASIGAAQTERMRITGVGNVGIGTTSPGTAYRLVVSTGVGQTGAIQTTGSVNIGTGALGVNVTPSATAGRIDASNDIVAFSSSDLRLKENIKPIENALDKVKSLTGVEFDWKPELKHAHGYEGHDTGVIAQEVQDVMPTAIRTNDTGYLAVRYEKLIGLLIEANKELAARVEELESKLK